MTGCVPIEEWPVRLKRVIAERCTMSRNVVVVREAASTQDSAREADASLGDVVVAWRQTSGRGRLGRRWHDTGTDGVAVTFVVPRGPPERLAIASAIGVAQAIEPLLELQVGIKWPNDIVVNGRKLAGILIEQSESRALVGVGINIRQMRWPEEIEPIAISFAQLGCNIDRIHVVCELIPALESALRMDHRSLAAAFTQRDVMRGRAGVFRHSGQLISGTVLRIDPMRGLVVQTQSGERWLPAATTTVLSTYPLGAESSLPSG